MTNVKKRFLFYGSLAILLAAITVPLFGRFTSTSICSICGAEETATDWQIPFTYITLWRTSSVSPTPLSAYLNSHGYAPPHVHAFLMANGSGNGVFRALGRGDALISAAHHPEIPAFLDVVQRFDGSAARARWQKSLLDPAESSQAAEVAELFSLSPSTTAAQFAQWKSDNADMMPLE